MAAAEHVSFGEALDELIKAKKALDDMPIGAAQRAERVAATSLAVQHVVAAWEAVKAKEAGKVEDKGQASVSSDTEEDILPRDLGQWRTEQDVQPSPDISIRFNGASPPSTRPDTTIAMDSTQPVEQPDDWLESFANYSDSPASSPMSARSRRLNNSTLLEPNEEVEEEVVQAGTPGSLVGAGALLVKQVAPRRGKGRPRQFGPGHCQECPDEKGEQEVSHKCGPALCKPHLRIFTGIHDLLAADPPCKKHCSKDEPCLVCQKKVDYEEWLDKGVRMPGEQ
ncbi:unnamed protein product, partial [Mesorhabditis spiculigera]